MTVALVGAGPGDPGLITVRGLELVRSCDVLVCDRLVADELVGEAPPDALRISRERLAQAQVSELLVSYGRAGLDVVRLKGGDPFVFGRGGEEALALAEAGIEFEVVPGVSSLSAVPASAGIPITQRGTASSVTAVTAHDPDSIDYEALALVGGTLVFFMGLAGLATLLERLAEAGIPKDTPAAVVSRGSLPDQREVVGTLESLAEAATGLDSPSLIVVGEVVALAGSLGRTRLPVSAASV